jgi:uncharacterized membrane protein YgdD (TMEM256/DUF423 family)
MLSASLGAFGAHALAERLTPRGSTCSASA